MTDLQCAGLQGPFCNAPQGEADCALILLHGWGADGHDLASLAPYLQASLPQLALYTPHAPDICSANPMGRQWFELSERFFSDPAASEADMDIAAGHISEAVMAFSDAVSVPQTRIMLGGFSQGGMMTLHLASQGRLPMAGYISIAGALVVPDAVQDATSHSAPITLIHGARDEVVPFQAMARAEDRLSAAGYQVTCHTRPEMGHAIDAETLSHIIAAFTTMP